jgi:hypothetical protein
MKTIKRIFGLSIIPLVLGSLTQCTNDGSVGPEELESIGVLQSTAVPRNAPWLSDYFPLNPHQFGFRTYHWSDEEGYSVAFIGGTETVPYTSGPIEATKLFLEDDVIGLYVDNRELWLEVIQGDYYVSVDCDLTGFPFPVAGKVWDGMFVDLIGLPAFLVNKDDPSKCEPLPPNDRLILFKIDDVNISGKRYNNALILWSLEPYPYQELKEFDDDWGITLPTSVETHGNAVDGFVILGFRKGVVALGETDLEGGSLDDLALLVSEVPLVASVTGHANLTHEGELRTFSFTARQYADGTIKGEWQRFTRSTNSKAHGDVTCLTVVGNEAWIGGITERTTTVGGEVGWRVVDNGEGSAPDQMSLQFAGGGEGSADAYCAAGPAWPPLSDIEGGDIQVN